MFSRWTYVIIAAIFVRCTTELPSYYLNIARMNVNFSTHFILQKFEPKILNNRDDSPCWPCWYKNVNQTNKHHNHITQVSDNSNIDSWPLTDRQAQKNNTKVCFSKFEGTRKFQHKIKNHFRPYEFVFILEFFSASKDSSKITDKFWIWWINLVCCDSHQSIHRFFL